MKTNQWVLTPKQLNLVNFPLLIIFCSLCRILLVLVKRILNNFWVFLSLKNERNCHTDEDAAQNLAKKFFWNILENWKCSFMHKLSISFCWHQIEFLYLQQYNIQTISDNSFISQKLRFCNISWNSGKKKDQNCSLYKGLEVWNILW